MALDGDMDDQLKYKIDEVMKVVRNRTQEEVAFILEYFGFDVDTSIDCFTEGGASDILRQWRHTNSMKSSNKNKKKKNKKKSQNSVPENASSAKTESVSNGASADTPSVSIIKCANSHVVDDSTSLLDSISSQVAEIEYNPTPEATTDSKCCEAPLQTERVKLATSPSLQRVKKELASASTSPDSVVCQNQTVVSLTSIANTPNSTTANVPDRISTSPSESSRTINRNRHRSYSGSHSRSSDEVSRREMPPPQAPAPLAASTVTAANSAALRQHPGKKILEKSMKDLSRQTVALHRVQNMLEEELENSFKRIKTAITEAQKLLEERHQELEQEMERVKKESRLLLTQRKDLAAELRQRAERASTMTEAELNELRADIKHFVVERKFDEELWKTIRFQWDKDRITQEIKTFGEVNHVKNSYSQRRQSVSSVASSSNMTSSITDPPELTTISHTELDQETQEPNADNVSDPRPQVTSYSNRPRFFFARRNYPMSDSGGRPNYNRGTYPPRGRGATDFRGHGMGRGGRREEPYRGGYEGSHHPKPHYVPHRGHEGEDHSNSSGAAGSGQEGSATGPGWPVRGQRQSGYEGGAAGHGWPIRDQRPMRRGGGRHNTRFQERGHFHSPRRNYGNEDRVSSVSDSHVNGNNAAVNLMNGFVDH